MTTPADDALAPIGMAAGSSENDDGGTEALARLRALRRTRRRRGADRFDRFYRIYVVGLISTLALYVARGAIDRVEVDAAALDAVRDNGPRCVAVLAGAALLVGVRSGVNGGPLALDELEVNHVSARPSGGSWPVRPRSGPCWAAPSGWSWPANCREARPPGSEPVS